MSQVDPIASVCIHEAGHAVMMRCMGMKVRSVEINRKAIASRRGQQGVTIPVVKMVTQIAYAQIAVAGVVAETIAFGGCPVRALNRLTDADELEEMMVASGVPKKERAAERRRIISMVEKRLRKHMDQVVAIAEEVGTHDVCTQERINEIMKVK
jgi:hypothetical protein